MFFNIVIWIRLRIMGGAERGEAAVEKECGKR